MPLVRVLVDGYSLLHRWIDLAPGKPRFSAAARAELIRALTHYQDLSGTPLTIVFDGGKAPPGLPPLPSTPEFEVLFSPKGKTADQIIERVTHLLSELGEVLVVTDDSAERQTVLSLGGMAASCTTFIEEINARFGEFRKDLERYNRTQRRHFKGLP